MLNLEDTYDIELKENGYHFGKLYFPSFFIFDKMIKKQIEC